ncbi:MAG: mandelate racemase/muconate lactonizing enzyme family protein [Spirochaetales bacterium]|nr:mandelate racemase/muconate lactonizing enzyme family protein [Spirochaetales bacterium]
MQNAVFKMYGAHHIFIEIESDGVSGIGEVVCFDDKQSKAYHAYLNSMAANLIGRNAELIGKIWKDLFTQMSGIGHSGLTMQALGAVDMALWDLNARSMGVPVWRLLGASKTELEVYASGGWLASDEELVEEALSYKAMGYRRFKMKLGKKDWREDITRIKKVKEACGDDFEIMADINQGWDVKKCLRMAPLLQELGITHFEEPVYAMNYDEQKFIKERVNLDVVAGEKLYGIKETSELLLGKCVDKMNPDIGRCGGVTGFMKVAHVAEICNIPVTSHAYAYFSIPCLAAIPNGELVELIPIWEEGLFDEDLKTENGIFRMNDKPGFGCWLSEKAMTDWCTEKTVTTG